MLFARVTHKAAACALYLPSNFMREIGLELALFSLGTKRDDDKTFRALGIFTKSWEEV